MYIEVEVFSWELSRGFMSDPEAFLKLLVVMNNESFKQDFQGSLAESAKRYHPQTLDMVSNFLKASLETVESVRQTNTEEYKQGS